MNFFKFFATFAILSSVFFVKNVNAEFSTSFETVPHSINYQWMVYNSEWNPIDYSLDFRFSLWKNWDFKNSDILENWEIKTWTWWFAGFQEVQTLKPDNNWFFHTAIGKNIPLPKLNSKIHKYLQIEVKPVDLDEASYEVLDIDSDINNITDRRVINSSAYAINADNVDNHSVWTNSWEIVVLNKDWKFDEKFFPNLEKNSKEISFESEDFLAKNVFDALVWLKKLITDQIGLFLKEKEDRVISEEKIVSDFNEKIDGFDKNISEKNKILENKIDENLAKVEKNFSEKISVEKEERILSDEKNILDLNEKLENFDKKILNAKEVVIASDEIVSENVEDAIVWLKKMFEGLIVEQEKKNTELINKLIFEQKNQVEDLKHEILLLKAENLLSLPVDKKLELQSVLWNWVKNEDWWFTWSQEGSIALSILDWKKHSWNTSIETIIDVNEMDNWKNWFIVFDYKNENDFKYVWIRVWADYWTIWEYLNWDFKDLAVNKENIPDNSVYHILVTIKDNIVALSVNWEIKVNHLFENWNSDMENNSSVFTIDYPENLKSENIQGVATNWNDFLVWKNWQNNNVNWKDWNDKVFWGNQDDLLFWWSGDDKIYWKDWNDVLIWDNWNDSLYWDDWDDIIFWWKWNDIILWKKWDDVSVYQWSFSEYNIWEFSLTGKFTITDSVQDRDGSDTIYGRISSKFEDWTWVSKLVFYDGVYSIADKYFKKWENVVWIVYGDSVVSSNSGFAFTERLGISLQNATTTFSNFAISTK